MEVGATMKAKKRFLVALIVPCDGWTPERWDDMPPSGRVAHVQRKPQKRGDAESFIYAWNWRHVGRPDEWAVLVLDSDQAKIGDPCHRQIAMFKAG